jgi:hypothetical protein
VGQSPQVSVTVRRTVAAEAHRRPVVVTPALSVKGDENAYARHASIIAEPRLNGNPPWIAVWRFRSYGWRAS